MGPNISNYNLLWEMRAIYIWRGRSDVLVKDLVMRQKFDNKNRSNQQARDA